MANRSKFPQEIDTFIEHYDLSANDIVKSARLQELLKKINRTAEEENELQTLKEQLRDKIITAEDFNYFQDCLTNMEVFIRDNIEGYIKIKQGEIYSATQDVIHEIDVKKDSIIEYLENTNVGALRNDIGVMGELKTTEKDNLVGAVNEVKEDIYSHEIDYVKHPAMGTSTNVGNNYSVTLSPAPTSYVNGMGILLTINANSTGNTTLNVNGLGAIPIKKGNGLTVTNLKANSMYTLRYSNGNFFLQGEGGEYGTAKSTEVLSGYTIGGEDGLISGTLSLTGNANASDVLSGKTFYNTDAKTKLTGTMPIKSAQTYTPSTVNQTISAGQYLSGTQTILGDIDLKAVNIRSGINIFGVVGTLAPLEHNPGTNKIGDITSVPYPTTSSASYRPATYETQVNYRGTYRLKFYGHLPSNGTGYYRVYKNGSPIGSEYIVGYPNLSIEFTVDLMLDAGDKIAIWEHGNLDTTSTNSYAGYVSSAALYSTMQNYTTNLAP